MGRYRFLTRPKWVLFSAAMLGLVVLMVNLALWQLRRLHERRAMNAVRSVPRPRSVQITPAVVTRR